MESGLNHLIYSDLTHRKTSILAIRDYPTIKWSSNSTSAYSFPATIKAGEIYNSFSVPTFPTDMWWLADGDYNFTIPLTCGVEIDDKMREHISKLSPFEIRTFAETLNI
jgi:hypothetical protein